MAEVLICPKGHQWDPSADGLEKGAGFVVCPVCGAEPTSDHSTGITPNGAVDASFGELLDEVGVPRGYPIGLGFVAGLVLLGGVVATFFIGKAIPTLIIVACAAVLALTLAIGAVACARTRLWVYERGMMKQGLLGRTRLAYGDVVTIRFPGSWPAGLADPLSRATVIGRDNRKIKVGMMADNRSLDAMNLVIERVIPRLGEEALERLQKPDDGKIEFGKATATMAGITFKGKTISWTEIERLNYSPEGVRIFPYNRPESTMVLPLKTPNVPLLTWLWQKRAATPTEATEAVTAEVVGPDGIAVAPIERVHGFPDLDPELGPLVCGKPRRPGVAAFMVAITAVGVLAAVIFQLQPKLPGAEILRYVSWGIIGAGLLGYLIARYLGFAVYERGIRTASRMMRWEDCEHVTYNVTDMYHHGAFIGRQVSLALKGTVPTVTIMGSGAKNEGFCTAVLDRVLPVVVAKRYQELAQGGSLSVGKVTLTRDSISYKTDKLPLDQVWSYQLQAGRFYVWRHGQDKPFIDLNAGKKDVHVLMHLLKALLHMPPGAPGDEEVTG